MPYLLTDETALQLPAQTTMIPLTRQQAAALKHWFLPDRPGVLVGLHVLHTGRGKFFADRWPAPRCLLVETGGNHSLLGDARAITARDLNGQVKGTVEAPRPFLPLLQEAFPDMKTWDRVILALDGELQPAAPAPFPVRRLIAADVQALKDISDEISWISVTWGGPEGLAGSGCAWGAFVDQHLVSVACSFFVGETYEDIGVVTEPAYRRLGLSFACAHALCQDILARGRRGSWSTATNNLASLAVAEKLGFQFARFDYLYVINQPIPEPPAPM